MMNHRNQIRYCFQVFHLMRDGSRVQERESKQLIVQFLSIQHVLELFRYFFRLLIRTQTILKKTISQRREDIDHLFELFETSRQNLISWLVGLKKKNKEDDALKTQLLNLESNPNKIVTTLYPYMVQCRNIQNKFQREMLKEKMNTNCRDLIFYNYLKKMKTSQLYKSLKVSADIFQVNSMA